MPNIVMRGYVKSIDKGLRNLYLEKEEIFNNYLLVVSIYKNVDDGKYYCATAIVTNGEYTFSPDGQFSGYYSENQVTRTDVCGKIMTELKQLLVSRLRLLSYISNSKEMPNVIHSAFNKELSIYYNINGMLNVATSQNGVIRIKRMENEKEQVFLTTLMKSVGITVLLDSEIQESELFNGTKRLGR